MYNNKFIQFFFKYVVDDDVKTLNEKKYRYDTKSSFKFVLQSKIIGIIKIWTFEPDTSVLVKLMYLIWYTDRI